MSKRSIPKSLTLADREGMLSSVPQKKAKPKQKKAPATGPSGVRLGEGAARAAIIRGASQVFAEQGVRSASVEDVLRAAGVSRRTFYRLYDSKEDVASVLYHIGTERLIEGCRRAVAQEPEPTAQINGCIDMHLQNAAEMGRLVYVLGGEAQRLESSLHARRMETHDILVQMLVEGTATARRDPVDPLLYRALLLALEGVTRMVLEQGDEGRSVSKDDIERARKVMRRMASSAILGGGEGVAPLPTLD